MAVPGTVEQDIETVETQFVTVADERDPFELKNGATLAPVTLAYETYGDLNETRDNAILVFHALTGSQHAAGHNPSVPGLGELWTAECQTGWWDGFIGPGKALDTSRFHVICANYIGGCYGSTGPSSISPQTGKPYGSSFPRITFSDIVDSQLRLLDELDIPQLYAAVGASIGGQLALSLATRYPDRVRVVIPIAAGLSVTPLQRIHTFEQIYTIEQDPAFNGGDYYDGPGPVRGLALARMISHKTFISLHAMEDRARFEVVHPDNEFGWYEVNHPLESYMLHQGRKLVKRFDANTYLRIMDAWQRFSLVQDAGAKHIDEVFLRCKHQRYLVFTIDSDVCYYPDEQEEMVRVLKEAGVFCTRITVHSDKGHDAFLLEPDLFAPYLAHTLTNGG